MISIIKSDLKNSPLDVKVTAGQGREGNSNKMQLPGFYVTLKILKQNTLANSCDK